MRSGLLPVTDYEGCLRVTEASGVSPFVWSPQDGPQLEAIMASSIEEIFFGGQAGAIDNVTIGDRAVFACYTAVTKDLVGGKIYSGSPAREISEKNKRDAVYIDVQQLKKRLKEIEKNFK